MNKGGRGKQFEAMLVNTFASFGPHTIVKTDPPVAIRGEFEKGGSFRAVFKAAGQCDFEGCWKDGLHVCLEAKDCSTGVFLKDRIRTAQMDRMDTVWNLGGVSGLLLRFQAPVANDDLMWLVPYSTLADLFSRRSRFMADDLTHENSYALAYGALGQMRVGVAGLEDALVAEAHKCLLPLQTKS